MKQPKMQMFIMLEKSFEYGEASCYLAVTSGYENKNVMLEPEFKENF